MNIVKNNVPYTVTGGYEWFWPGFANGTWEPETFKIFDRFLDPERNFVDIGAWIGPTTLYAAHKAKQVFAFEPDQVAFRHLDINLRLNQVKNVVAYPIAVSNAWKQMQFGPKTGFGDSMASELWGAEQWNTVPAISLEAVLEVNPNFIKIDIEGGEKFIFNSPSIKYALAYVKPTIHLSLHTPWFAKDSETLLDFTEAIRLGLQGYPFFYNENLEKIDLNDPVFDPNAFTSIVASYQDLNA